jgi:hypothetical protein
MFTELMLRQHPALIRAFTGIPAEAFWEMLEKMEAQFSDYETGRHTRDGRQRAVGGGRKFGQPLALRTVAVLAYLRLHIPQQAVALMFGLAQCDISRDLRRLLPLITAILPCPVVWEMAADSEALEELVVPTSGELPGGRVLIDATEQRVSRPGKDNATRKWYFSGKKKAFTLKTQVVADDDIDILAISVCVPGAVHDKKLSDGLATVARLPDGCEALADKGYQGMAGQVDLVAIRNPETGLGLLIPRLTVCTPFKKVAGQELTEQQQAFNSRLGTVRVRVEHGIGWIKNWAIMANRFRCSHLIYTAIMQTVCGLVNAQTQRWQMTHFAYCA